MNQKHTQGPWKYKQRGTQIWGRSIGGCQMIESEHLIADIRGWGHIQYLPDAEQIQDANGQLIAAAPDLLMALEMGVKETLDYIQRNNLTGAENNHWIVLAKEAIAKATGNKP